MKKNNFSIIYFLLLFVILYYGFIIFIGLITPGGKFYSSFLNYHLNIPYWFSIVLAKAAKALLQLAGFATYQKTPSNVTIDGSRGVTIAWACLGIGVISTWIAFVVAHKEKVLYKLKWVLIGTASICLINIFRIMMIALSNHYHWKYIRSYNAHTIFNIIAYIFIFLLMFVFVFYYNRKRGTV